VHKREFGKTGLYLSPIALGGHEYLTDGRSRGFNEDMRLATTPGYIAEGYGGAKRKRVLSQAYDLGINIFDVTIDSEKEALGRNFFEMPPPYEVYVQSRPEGMCYSYDPNNAKMLDYALLREEVQRILKLIRRDSLDFLNIGLLAWSIDNEPDYMDRLSHNLGELKREGLIRHAVADSFSGERLYLAMIGSGAFDAVNVDLNAGDTGALPRVIPAARAAGQGFIAREAFLKGELFRIGAACGIEDRGLLARAAMKWLAQHEPDCIILGVDTAEQLASNCAALGSPQFSEGELAALKRIQSSDEFLAYKTKKQHEFLETTSA
jgi:aryl-alcohol dehydrogenase-like predicted oxidoreductase